ncbi:hypothetical protein J6590_025493 [Homalodisca vitripennis]|nr:hypothetical protein J6590_025493 [Homalodisca vitripennis]
MYVCINLCLPVCSVCVSGTENNHGAPGPTPPPPHIEIDVEADDVRDDLKPLLFECRTQCPPKGGGERGSRPGRCGQGGAAPRLGGALLIDFDHECEQDLILTEVEETAEILKEKTSDKLKKGTVEMLNYQNKNCSNDPSTWPENLTDRERD